ncbi:MAG TPA: hypothetical protein PLX15_00615 [Candidatus Woesearchaeota archaeon]|nr:hypothetical protein [Candidatus Woesearchaeota archaeon]
METNKFSSKIKGTYIVYGRKYEVEIKEWTEEIQGLCKTPKKIKVWGYNINPIPQVNEEERRKMVNQDYDALMSIIKEYHIF